MRGVASGGAGNWVHARHVTDARAAAHFQALQYAHAPYVNNN